MAKQRKVTQAIPSRKANSRQLKKIILIACEDSTSSPQYFRAVNQYLHAIDAPVRLEVVESRHKSSPKQVLAKAVATRRRDYAFRCCVLDGEHQDEIKKIRSSADKKAVELYISTPCFEYWIFVHFEQRDPLFPDCASVNSEIKKICDKFDKNSFDYKAVLPSTRKAMEATEKLLDPTKLPEDHNPSSTICRLFRTIEDICGNWPFD